MTAINTAAAKVHLGRTPAQACREAAAILERDANDLQACHTVAGRWIESKMDQFDKSARAECINNRNLARELRAHAKYIEPNPLGGPARVFIAMAQRIQAGEAFNDVLDDYGFMVKPTRKRRR